MAHQSHPVTVASEDIRALVVGSVQQLFRPAWIAVNGQGPFANRWPNSWGRARQSGGSRQNPGPVVKRRRSVAVVTTPTAVADVAEEYTRALPSHAASVTVWWQEQVGGNSPAQLAKPMMATLLRRTQLR